MLNRGPALLAQLNAQLCQTCLYLTGRCAPPSTGGNVVPIARPLMRLKVLNPLTSRAASCAFSRPAFGSGGLRRGRWWSLSAINTICRSGSSARIALATGMRLPLSKAEGHNRRQTGQLMDRGRGRKAFGDCHGLV